MKRVVAIWLMGLARMPSATPSKPPGHGPDAKAVAQRPWRLTRAAEASLINIAGWMFQTFGPRQAEAYEDDLSLRAAQSRLARPYRDCRRLIDPDLPEDLRYTRCGQHFIVFVEDPAQVIIVDFLHSRSDLPGRLAGLAEAKIGFFTTE